MQGMKDWERWLTGHQESSPGVWLMIARKGSALISVSYAEALEAALCHGWIDGQKQAHDSEAWLQNLRRAEPEAFGRRSTGRRRNSSSRAGG